MLIVADVIGWIGCKICIYLSVSIKRLRMCTVSTLCKIPVSVRALPGEWKFGCTSPPKTKYKKASMNPALKQVTQVKSKCRYFKRCRTMALGLARLTTKAHAKQM